VGYGLVVGLAGTGDALRNAPFTGQSLEAMLERLGINTRDARLNTKNVAAVMVTAKLPPFAAAGSEMDATVSAMGSAKSLLGGTLLVTPLQGADGQTYAVAQGSVQTGAVSAQGASGSSVSKGVPTAGRIAGWGDRRTRDGIPVERDGASPPHLAQSRFHHGGAHRRSRESPLPGDGPGAEPHDCAAPAHFRPIGE